MKNDFGQFSEGLVELAQEMWEYRTCQRADGSYYGTSGQCRKGTETDKVEKEKKPKPKISTAAIGSALKWQKKLSYGAGKYAGGNIGEIAEDGIAADVADQVATGNSKSVPKHMKQYVKSLDQMINKDGMDPVDAASKLVGDLYQKGREGQAEVYAMVSGGKDFSSALSKVSAAWKKTGSSDKFINEMIDEWVDDVFIAD
ncbi:MAG: hypothetical protein VXX91_03995 [Planctomycetota bacterium]|nr:hypothetical protein [Planctomycetota bacterium]